MQLQQVTYRLFEHEREQVWDEALWHQLDGEVVLVMTGEVEFISWCDRPTQYSMGRKHTSFFSPQTLCDIDLSQHPMWCDLIGSDISIRFVDSEHQVLQVEGAGRSIFLSSQYDDGQFQGDCVRVSRVNPL